MTDQRITCPRPHANHLLFSLTAGGDIAVKCRGCHEVYVISWAELEAKRRAVCEALKAEEPGDRMAV